VPWPTTTSGGAPNPLPLRNGGDITLGEVLSTNGLPFGHVHSPRVLRPHSIHAPASRPTLRDRFLLVYRPLLFQRPGSWERCSSTPKPASQFGYLASGIIISLVVLLTALLLGSLVSQRLHRIFSKPHP